MCGLMLNQGHRTMCTLASWRLDYVSWLLDFGSFLSLLVLLVLLVHFVPMDPYQKLLERFKEVQLLKSTSAGLEWDEQTYLPKKAVHYRAEQLSYLASKAHLLATAPEVGEWLSACEQIGYPEDSDQAPNIFHWRHDYELATKLPVAFVEEFERTAALAREA